eukprot:gene2217-2733_t
MRPKNNNTLKLKELSKSQLKHYLDKKVNTETSQKLADILFKEDIDGTHLIDFDKNDINELCPTLGLKKEFNKMIKMLDECVLEEQTSVSTSVQHKTLCSSVTNMTTKAKHEIPSSGKGFDFSSLDDGNYKVEIYSKEGLSTPILLKSFDLEKKDGEYTPDFVDLSASLLKFGFYSFDKPVQNSDLTGTIKINGIKDPVKIQSKTDETGCFSTILPKSDVSLKVTGKVDGKQVEINQNYPIESPPPVKSLEDAAKSVPPKLFQQSVNGTEFHIQVNQSKTVYLCDVSGSMSTNGRITQLKKTLHSLIESKKELLSVVSWNHNFFLSSIGNKWMTNDNKQELLKWVDGLVADGLNQMEQAIEKGILNFPDAEDFVILCDGDVNPFNIDSWTKFSLKNSKYRFSFVGIGESSDSQMKNMAQIGRGQYYSC